MPRCAPGRARDRPAQPQRRGRGGDRRRPGDHGGAGPQRGGPGPPVPVVVRRGRSRRPPRPRPAAAPRRPGPGTDQDLGRGRDDRLLRRDAAGRQPLRAGRGGARRPAGWRHGGRAVRREPPREPVRARPRRRARGLHARRVTGGRGPPLRGVLLHRRRRRPRRRDPEPVPARDPGRAGCTRRGGTAAHHAPHPSARPGRRAARAAAAGRGRRLGRRTHPDRAGPPRRGRPGAGRHVVRADLHRRPTGHGQRPAHRARRREQLGARQRPGTALPAGRDLPTGPRRHRAGRCP
ncbi:hypothetical protein ENKNEFLB_02172 [Nocardioides aquaticus]|uniref:Uncharacterized protein n=1 Tax=Nocardioides aquaticus TaxID=160826 RepID=A0ABX8EGX3_9ACTN|nr:hypothetical protein ENKNEFLB_02172 [Nocardioides aquaticus]